MNADQLVVFLETQWADGELFDRLRVGVFSQQQAGVFLECLRTAHLPLNEDGVVPVRLLSIAWFIPLFLTWQKERVAEASGAVDDYARFLDEVFNILTDVLGAP